MTRLLVWLQIVFILCCLGYSTYSFFKGDFEQAFLPYPVLILYYLLFSRRKVKRVPSAEEKDTTGGY